MAYKKSTQLLPYQYQPTRNVFRSAGASTNSCSTIVVSDSGSVHDLHEWEWGGVDIQSEVLCLSPVVLRTELIARNYMMRGCAPRSNFKQVGLSVVNAIPFPDTQS